MGIEVGAPLGEFLGSVVEVSKPGALADAALSAVDNKERPMSPGQDLATVLGPTAIVASIKPDSGLTNVVARMPLEIDFGKVDPLLLGTAMREQREADAAMAAVKSSVDPTNGSIHAGIESREAGLAAEAVKKAAASASAKAPKMK